MKLDIILAGVGGQGILTVATIIGEAAMHQGWSIKQAEVHGMSQRGGDVMSCLRISDGQIHSDLIPLQGADVIISLEPMEALRYLPYLNPDRGWIITNDQPFVNIPNYPAPEALDAEYAKWPRALRIDVESLAKQAGSPRAANIVLLGAAQKALGIDTQLLIDAIGRVFARKGEDIVESNVKAFNIGAQQA